MIDEDAAHDAGRDGKEVRAVLPIDAGGIDQPQVGLVDERGGLVAVAFVFTGEAAARDLAELLVHDRHQRFESGFVAVPPFDQ